VDILGVVNRERESEDRVVVRVRARLERGAIDERWTLLHRGARWRRVAEAGDPLAEPLLKSPLITGPENDDQRLNEASLQELSAEPRTDATPGELVDTTAPPPQQLRDLAVADERFDPMLIEAAVEHIVQAWEQSSDGSDTPLLAVATGAGAHALMFPAGRGRRGVRDARLQRWEITRVKAAETPPCVEVRLRVRATLSPERRPRRLDLVWTLALDEAARGQPRWRLAHSADAT
jgi:hypothetical protein